MDPTINMQAMSWTEYHRRLTEEDAIVMVPVGSLEQHGPHLPMGTDAFVPTALAERAAVRIGAIVAAPFNYGYKSQPRSGGVQSFPGPPASTDTASPRWCATSSASSPATGCASSPS